MRDRSAREQTALNEINKERVMRNSYSPAPQQQPYQVPHHPFFNQEIARAISDGILGVAQEYVDGIQRIADIQQGNYIPKLQRVRFAA